MKIAPVVVLSLVLGCGGPAFSAAVDEPAKNASDADAGAAGGHGVDPHDAGGDTESTSLDTSSPSIFDSGGVDSSPELDANPPIDSSTPADSATPDTSAAPDTAVCSDGAAQNCSYWSVNCGCDTAGTQVCVAGQWGPCT
jgi:hypothetical protein